MWPYAAPALNGRGPWTLQAQCWLAVFSPESAMRLCRKNRTRPWTRSMLQTDEQFPSVSSQQKGVSVNPDSSVDTYFAPKAPAGHENNWVQTWPWKGWNVILR